MEGQREKLFIIMIYIYATKCNIKLKKSFFSLKSYEKPKSCKKCNENDGFAWRNETVLVEIEIILAIQTQFKDTKVK